MKKYYKYRYYGLILIGIIIIICGAINIHSYFGLILWGIGIIISMTGVSLQIIFAPNFDKKNDDKSD